MGGYLDQDYVLLNKMTTLANIYQAVKTVNDLMDIGKSGKDGHKRIPKSSGRIYKQLKDAGII